MLKELIQVSKHSFLIQRREQVFYAAIGLNVFMTLFAHVIDDLAIEYSNRILNDILIFCLSFMGGMIAIFWGTQSMTFSTNSAPHVSLTSSISRGVWVVGEFLGLSITFVCLSLLNCAVWQMILLFNGGDMLTPNELLVFPLNLLAWLVIASFSFFFSSFSGRSTALFLSLSFWLVGTINPILSTSAQYSHSISGKIIKFLDSYWNLQRFSISPDLMETFPIQNTILYGFSLILFFISATCLIVRKKDL